MEATAPEILDIQRKLEEERQQLEHERRKFTEAAIKLGKEREALIEERQMMDAHMMSMKTNAMLNQLPETPEYVC